MNKWDVEKEDLGPLLIRKVTDVSKRKTPCSILTFCNISYVYMYMSYVYMYINLSISCVIRVYQIHLYT